MIIKILFFPLIFSGALLMKRRDLSVTVHDFLEQLCAAAETYSGLPNIYLTAA